MDLVSLRKLIAANEDWLIQRILHHAKKHDYAKYTSTLAEAWRLSISGLSSSLEAGLDHYGAVPELNPDDDFQKDPLTQFGIVEARRHRERGVSLSMFLGLMKYYRQCYRELLDDKEKDGNAPAFSEARLYIERSFDRIEIAFCQEWAGKENHQQIAELQDSNRRITNEKTAYLTVFESISDPVIILNKEHQIINLNHAAISLIDEGSIPGASYYQVDDNRYFSTNALENGRNLTCDSVIGCAFESAFPWLEKAVRKISSTKKQIGAVECNAVINQKQRFFEVKASQMLDISEKYISTILSLREITKRKKAQEDLRESERRYKSLFRNNHAVMLLIDPENGRIMDANPAAVHYYRYDHHTLLTMKISEINTIPPDEVKQEMKFARQQKRNQFFFKHRLATGETRDVEVYSGPITVEGRQLLYSIVHDITDRKKMERALQESNRELDDFAYIASHDLREPLRGIANYATFLMEDYGDEIDDEGKAKLETLKRLCKREEDLIQSLLSYSRLGRTDLKYNTVNLNDLIAEAKETLELSFPDHAFTISVPKSLPSVKCDPVRIGEVFVNLMSNAIKYNERSEKHIEVGYIDTPGHPFNLPEPQAENIAYPVFSISDNGIGIPSKHQEKIFTIFKRLHGRDKFGGGTGAGLTIVKKIIERHGGMIWLESSVGQGTTFYFTLSNQNPRSPACTHS